MKKILLAAVFAVLLVTACSRDGGKSEPPASEPPASEVTTTPTWREVHSDNQAFSLKVPDGFELSAEEPGNDVVLSNQDERAFMRIQLFDDNPQSAKYLVRDTQVMLGAVTGHSSVQRLSETPLKPAQAEDISAWRVGHPEGDVLAVIFRQNQHWVRLILFNHKHSEAMFLRIAETLQCDSVAP